MEGKSDFSIWVPLCILFGPSLINLIVLGVAVCLGKAKEYAGKDPLWVLLPAIAHAVCFCAYPMMLYEWLNKIVTRADQRNRAPEPGVQEKPKEQTLEEKYPNIFAAGWKICRFAEYMLRVRGSSIPKSFACLRKTGDMFWFVYKGVAIEAHVNQRDTVVNVGELVSIHASGYVGGYRSLFVTPTQCGMDVDRLEKFFAGMLAEIDTTYREVVEEENKAAIELVASLPVEGQDAAS